MSSSREPRGDVPKPSSSAHRDEVKISLEAKKRQLLDQIVGQVVQDITARTAPETDAQAAPRPANG
ncbi:MAG: hypothetical protein ACE5IM_00255 [Nitrospinota bacterium]